MNNPNPYAAPTSLAGAAGAAQSNAIDSLPVSDAWKTSFHLIEKAGGPKLPGFNSLSMGEKWKIFSVLGFFFGPLYYLFKGMWKKGLLVLTAAFCLLLLCELAGYPALGRGVGFAVGLLCAKLAHGDYYRKMVLGENHWW